MTDQPKPTDIKKLSLSETLTTGSLLIRLILLAVIDSFVVWFILALVPLGNIILAIAVAIIALLVNIIILRSQAAPLRWMIAGLILMAMFAVYPILYTVYVSTTNYGFGHLLTKEQAVQQFENVKYLPEGKGAFTWTAFRSDSGDFALWLQNDQGQGFLALPDQPITSVEPGQQGVGSLDADGNS